MTTKPFTKLGTDYENVAHFMIKNQPVGFLWANSALEIKYIAPELKDFLPSRDVKKGEHLAKHFPEIIGLEAAIQEVLIWQREPIFLENINLKTQNEETRYITLILYAGKQDGEMGIFLVVQDTTKSGKIIQELNQSRNELRLLKRELELTNTALSKINQVQGLNIVAAAREVSKLYERSQEEIAERKELEKQLKQAYNETLKGWSLALNLRDENTDKHSQRVIEITVRLCSKLGVPEDELNYVRWGATLHDIGKMGVPDKILLKASPLTADEWKVMELHPTFAYEMLSNIPFLKAAVDIPYNHHERWDGSGYPRGLAKEEIPLTARAFSIIDTFDALTSDRIYRPAWSKEDALVYIESQIGIKFDPEIVPIFLDMIRDSV